MDGHRQSRPVGTQAVDWASRLLIEVLSSSEPISVSALALATGLHQSTVSRLLASLGRHSAGGKVLLASGAATLDDDSLKRFTPMTITDRELLAKELARVRLRGFALLIDEYELGLRAVAVPVREPWGAVVAALAASGPSLRLPKRRLLDCVEMLVTASSRLSGQLAILGGRDGVD